MENLFKKLCLCVATILLCTGIGVCTSVTAHTRGYYIATNGSDNNKGTIKKPFATIAKAQEVASSGDTVYILGGTYKNFTIADSDINYNYVHEITKSGITYKAYSSKDVPIFDFSNVSTSKRVAAFRIASTAKDVKFISIKVTGVPVGNQKQSECFRIEGNATFNQVTCCNNQANGFYFTIHGKGECIRCDSYNNIGIGPSIGNTDGFGAHGDGVIFKECRAWNCSDDGYDCISSNASNTFNSCWAFNMNAGGDSNGFKAGGFGKRVITHESTVNTVKNCIAANNGAHGFYANHQPGQAATWSYNTSYNNKAGNFNMVECLNISTPTDIDGTREALHYNLAYKNNSLDRANLPSQNNTNNSWNLSGSDISENDFQSLDASQLAKPRGPHGELPHITFMKLTKNSKFKGLGCSAR